MTNRKNKLLKKKEFKGINLTSREKELLEDRVNKIYEVLTQATNCFPRTFAFRVDLRFPHGYKFGETFPYMKKFFGSLESQITEELKRRKRRFSSVSEERLRYVWCKEIDKSDNPHYHLVIFLNKDNFQSVGNFKRFRDEHKCKHLYQMLLYAWARVLGIELEEARRAVQIPDNATYKVKTFEGEEMAGNEEFTNLFNRSIYLAKARTRAIGVSRSFGRSSK